MLKIAHMRSSYRGNWATEKKVAGGQVTAYTGKSAILSSSLSTKKWPAQKETKIAAMDMKIEVNPAKSFLGNSLPESFSSYLDVRIARNVTVEVTKSKEQ